MRLRDCDVVTDADSDLAHEATRRAQDDSIADQLLSAIDAALSAFVSDAPLRDAAAPLMTAIEAVRQGARAALFEVRRLHAPVLLAAPSFAPQEADAVAAWVADELGRADPTSDPNANLLAWGRLGDADVELQIYPVVVSHHHPVGCIALLSPADGVKRKPAPRRGHLKRFAHIAGIMIEDRVARRERDEREMLLHRLMDTSPDAVVRITTDGAIVGFNAAAETMFGWKEAEALGQPISILMSEEHALRHTGYVARYMKTHERRLPTFGRRLEARRMDGTGFPVEVALAEFKEQGETQFVGIVRDITFRVQSERKVDELRDALGRATQLSLLGEMAATIAHEVNQPLAAAASYVDAAAIELEQLEGIGDAPEIAHLHMLLGQAGAQARLGGEIIKRLRRLTERSTPVFEEEDLNDVVREAAVFLADTARGHGVRLEQRYADNLPPIRADRVQVQQVVSNLVRNAIEAVRDAPIRRVTLETRAAPDGVEIEVSDTGAGVPEDMRETVFDSFVTGREDGVGLGLAITRSIVENHAGRIWVEDHTPSGATFRVRLPKPAAHEADGHD
jgi:two-component system sensor kinase FixL